MENIPVQAQPQSQNMVPPVSQPKTGMGRTLAVVISLIIIVIVLGISTYLLFANKTPKTYNAQVYNTPTPIMQNNVTPTMSNPKDTSNNAITQDTQAVNQELNNLNSDLNNVDQSFNDQQTNLQ